MYCSDLCMSAGAAAIVDVFPQLQTLAVAYERDIFEPYKSFIRTQRPELSITESRYTAINNGFWTDW